MRERLIEQNSGVFLSNEEGIKLARNESVSRVLIPRNYIHDTTITSQAGASLTDLNETDLDLEIRKILALQNFGVDTLKETTKITKEGYEQMKARLSPRAARLSNHSGHKRLKDYIESKANILNQIEQ